MGSRLWLLGLALAIVLGVASVYLGLAAGMTPNLALAGTFIAAICMRRLNWPGDRLAQSMNVMEALSTAGNAAAAALAFTLPLVFLCTGSLDWGTILRAALSSLGGVSAAFLLVVFRAERLTRSGPEAIHGGTSNESVAILSLIKGLTARVVDRRPLVSGMLLFAVLVGFLSGVLKGMATSPFAVAVAERPDVALGWNPALIALGAMMGLDKMRGVLVGSCYAVVLGSALLAAAAVSQETPSPLQPSPQEEQQLPVERSDASRALTPAEISERRKHLVLEVGALILGLASVASIIEFGRKGGSVGPTESSLRRGFTGVRRVFGVTLLPVIASIGLAVSAMATSASSADAVPLLHIFPVLAGVTVAGILVAERVVHQTGSSLMPSSALALLMGVLLAFVWDVRSPSFIAVTCAFVVGAGSAAAGLSQDLLIGATLRTERRTQVRAKWWGTACAIIAVAVAVGFLFESPQASHFSTPSPKALKAITSGVLGSDLQWKLLAVAALTYIGAGIVGIHPLLLAVGVLLPLDATLPLFIGGGLMWLLFPPLSGADAEAPEDPVRLQKRAAVLAGLAIVLGSFGVISAMAAFVQHRANGDLDRWATSTSLFTLPLAGLTIWLAVRLKKS